jgi:hypothetical protein
MMKRGLIVKGLGFGLAAGLFLFWGAAVADDSAGFRAVCAEQAAAAEQAGTPAVEGRDGWLYLPAELRHIGVGRFWGADAAKVSRATNPTKADPLPAILDFHQQLAKAGIELIFVPVPPKAIVHPEGLGGGVPARADEFHAEFYGQLRQAGVNVLDLTDDFRTLGAAGSQPYCRQDTHWSGQACVAAAQKIAAEIAARPWRQDLPKKAFTSETAELQITGDLWLLLNKPELPKETLPLRFVRDENGAPPADDRSSPIVLLGDSHNLVFHAGGDMQATGAGLADQLALELGTTIDVLGVRGSGATPSRINFYRRIQADPGYLAGKKLVIWCLSAREFTEASGWSLVPLTAP